MTDVLFINPSGAHGIYGSLGRPLIAVEPQMWLRVAPGFLRSNGKSVAVIDAEQEGSTPESVAQRVVAMGPRLVAIVCMGHQPSASTQSMPGARAIAAAIKRLDPNQAILMFGGHVSALPERTLREESINYAVVGEGPRTILALLDEPDEPASNPGLVWRDGERVVVNPRAAGLDLKSDLKDWAWDLTPPEKYASHNWHHAGHDGPRSPYASVFTTMNCPFRCQFCCISSPFGGSGYQMRDPDDVVDEIEYLHREHGVRLIKIIDELFVLRPSHYLPIVDGLAARGLGEVLNIWAYARSDTVKPETLTRLRAGGIRWLAIGIESGSKDVLEAVRKGDRTVDIMRTVKQIQEAGINVIGNFIFGLSSDTRETMQLTLDLAMLLNTEWANFYSCQAYPGSPLYEEAVAKGWTLPATWAGYSQHNKWCRPLSTEYISAKEVLQFRDEAFIRYFSNERYQQMILNKFGQETVEHIRSMLSYKLERLLLSGEIT